MFMKFGQWLHFHASITLGDLHYRLRGLLPPGGASKCPTGAVFTPELLSEKG